jgi:hypothetical protein
MLAVRQQAERHQLQARLVLQVLAVLVVVVVLLTLALQ